MSVFFYDAVKRERQLTELRYDQLWDDIGVTRGKSWWKDLRFYLVYVPLILIAAGPLSMLVRIYFSSATRRRGSALTFPPARSVRCITSQRYVEAAALRDPLMTHGNFCIFLDWTIFNDVEELDRAQQCCREQCVKYVSQVAVIPYRGSQSTRYFLSLVTTDLDGCDKCARASAPNRAHCTTKKLSESRIATE